MDGSDQADYLERLIREVESDPDYVDPFNDNPELEQMLLNASEYDCHKYLAAGGKFNQSFAIAWMKATR